MGWGGGIASIYWGTKRTAKITEKYVVKIILLCLHLRLVYNKKNIILLYGLPYCLNSVKNLKTEVFDSFPGKDFYSVTRTMNI